MSPASRDESHIVVVDARPADYGRLVSLAGEQPWHLHFLTTARAAITFLRRARADLWLINALLPDLSGFAVYESLSEQVNGAAAVLISDRDDAEIERRACQCGATLYLCKGPEHVLDCRPIMQLLAARRRLASPSFVSSEFLQSLAGDLAGSVGD